MAAIRPGMPGSFSVALVMGRPWRNSMTVAPLSGEVVEDRRADTEGGRYAGAVELVRAVDGQELGGRARDAHDEG